MSSYHYGNQTPNNNKKQTGDEVLSWILIAACFIVFWPLGLFLLIRKLMDSTKRISAPASRAGSAVPPGWAAPGQEAVPAQKQSVSSRMLQTPSEKHGTRLALKIIGALVLVCGAYAALQTAADIFYFFPDIYRFEIIDLLQECAVAGAGGLMLGKGLSLDRAAQRYANYLAVIGPAQSMDISRLAAITGRPEETVIRDLNHMIEKGLFGPTAYLDLSLGYLFLSRTAAEEDEAQKRAAAPTPKEAEEGYAGVLRSIRRANDRIADPSLSAKIDRLEEVTAQIFRAIEKDEKKAAQVRTFLEYYLPTTQKLLDSYAEFEAAGIEGENLRMAKEKIEDTMDSIVQGFERQLDALYAAEAMDIQSDIDVMNNMMQRDSAMHASDFQVSDASGAAAAEAKEETN